VYFLRLIRPINLIIIALTMYGVHYYIISVFGRYQKINSHPVDFFLLVFSTILIAAGGNIINDYFDVKADRINKPEKLIISKHIKRRWAIVTHWSFNGAAFLIAIYLSIAYQTLWLVFIHLLSINSLWFYSMLFKRKVMIGNLLIALLTALVPVLVVIFFKVSNWHNPEFSPFDPTTWSTEIDYTFVYVLAFFAFIQNLAREIIKDIQDMKGDELIYVKSLPMVVGIQKSFLYIKVLLLLFPGFSLISFIYFSPELIKKNLVENALITLPYFLILAINIFVIYLIAKTNGSKLSLYHNLIKLTMLIGVLSTFYFAYFQL
jgi:4-hydroxybenzoate polyprenyltransferase